MPEFQASFHVLKQNYFRRTSTKAETMLK